MDLQKIKDYIDEKSWIDDYGTHLVRADQLEKFIDSIINQRPLSRHIKITENKATSMLVIESDGKTVFDDNTWDFDRSARGFKALFEKIGLQVEVEQTEQEP